MKKIKIITLFSFLFIALFTQYSHANATSSVKIYSVKKHRIIEFNGLPPHNKIVSENKLNPNKIKKKPYKIAIPLIPKYNPRPTYLKNAAFGVALDGILFDSTPDYYWKNKKTLNWPFNPMATKNYHKIDSFNGHPSKEGTYHYHGIPHILINNNNNQVFLGYAADGFPIYNQYIKKKQSYKLKPSYRIKRGNRVTGPKGKYTGLYINDFEYVPGLGDLDECNGYFGSTKEYPQRTYMYILTDTYPHMPPCFRGTPHLSILKVKKQQVVPKKNIMRNANY